MIITRLRFWLVVGSQQRPDELLPAELVLGLRLNIGPVMQPAGARALTLLWNNVSVRTRQQTGHFRDGNITTCEGRGTGRTNKTKELNKDTDCWVSGTVKEVSVEGWLVQVTG